MHARIVVVLLVTRAAALGDEDTGNPRAYKLGATLRGIACSGDCSMRVVSGIFLCLVALLGSYRACAGDALSAADQVAQMKRGVNIVGYDPLWHDPAKGRFKPRHFKIIKDGGFDTVRINLYGFRQMNDKLELSARWYDILDGLVKEALAQKLNVILDEHDYEACAKSAAECRR